MNLILTDTQRTTTEHFGTIPVTLGTTEQWVSIYYLPILNLVAGEVIQMYGEAQVRNDLGINIEYGQCLELRTSVSGGQEPLGTPGGFTGVINGWNITPDMHYGRASKGDSYLVPADVAALYLVLRLRCRSTGALPGNTVTVNIGQGVLYYNRFTPQ